MARRIVILNSAKQDVKDIRGHVKKVFGDGVWHTVHLELRQAVERIKSNPALGSHVEELKDLGIENVRSVLVRQTRVVYEFDEDWVILHMFIHTRRDFRSYLFRRFFSQ